MSLGIAILCHTALDRVIPVARFWAQGGAAVTIHVDARVSTAEMAEMRGALAGHNVHFLRRRRGNWGAWALVAAAQEAAAQLLTRPEVSHVLLMSGACLPLRPVADLEAFLDAHPRTDFIESVSCADADWAAGGLGIERFTLRFPFSWRKQRRLFDAWVRIQRRFGLNRALPRGIEPHLGSQWWCLTRETLCAILTDPRRGEYDRWFRRVWIPDESYFQTLARHHSRNLESRSLTFARFDERGRPQMFFDDHEAVLRASGCFIARKIWPGAEALYRAFLAPSSGQGAAPPRPAPLERLFSEADHRRRDGRPGLYMQSRFPRLDYENGKTRGPYSIFQGFTDLFVDFVPWLSAVQPGVVHGHLFAPGRAEFAGGARIGPGCLSDDARLRDYNPRAFLTNLLWNANGTRQSFMLSPRDMPMPDWFVATDPNAQISVITGAWAVPLLRSGRPVAGLRREAARLHRIETQNLSILRSVHAKARVRVWSLAEFAANPSPLHEILAESGGRCAALPPMVDLFGLAEFLRALRNAGMLPRLMGDFPVDADHEGSGARRNG